MKKVIKLTEADLNRIVRRVIQEQEDETQNIESDKTDYKLLRDYLTLKNGFEYVDDLNGEELYQLKKGGYSITVAVKPSDEPFHVDLRVFVSFPGGKMINYLKEVRGASRMKVRMNDYGKILQALQGASDFGRAQSDYDNIEPLPKF
jgi:hypothetical protein